jgi:uncharacterized OB-fold protein
VPAPRAIAPGLFSTDGAAPRLRAARCVACMRLHFPAADSCPYCGHDVCDDQLVGATGTLYLYTAIATRPPGYRGALPYGFGVVELPEGLRVVTRLTETDVAALRPGLPMRLVVEPLFTDDDGTPVLSWAYAPEAS